MKIISGPRRIGKTTQLIKQWLDSPNGLFIVQYESQRKYIINNYKEIPKEKHKDIIMWNNIKGRPSVPLFIENAEFILMDLIGASYIEAITMTGPSFHWNEEIKQTYYKTKPKVLLSYDDIDLEYFSKEDQFKHEMSSIIEDEE